MRFEWDPEKDRSNQAEHGLSFQEASALFGVDVDSLTVYDEEHSADEDRFKEIGPIDHGVIVVVYTERDVDVIRILSARMATKDERQRYRESLGEKHE